MARFAVGHSREVAARHYADLPSLRPLHEAAVADAFRAALAAAMPTILPPTAEQTLREAPEQAGPLMPPDTVGPLLDGEQDVWLAACAGFHSSPFAEADRKSTRLNSSHYCASRMPSSACTKKK